jgi:DNA-binding transcriptional regulator LsrR (DeoR family)
MSREISKLNLSELGRMVDIARMYHIQNMSQQEIAQKKKISQGVVSRDLKNAQKYGILEVKVEIKPEFRIDLEKELKKHFDHLDEVHISHIDSDEVNPKDLMQVLGYEGAKYFARKVENHQEIGFSCGKTLNALVRSISSSQKELNVAEKKHCHVYALVHPCIREIVDPTPASLVASAIRQMSHSIGYGYQLPRPIKKNDKTKFSAQDYRVLPDIQKLMDKMENLQFYFVGIGQIDYSYKGGATSGVGLQFNHFVSSLGLMNDLEELGAVGECDFQPFDRDGNFLTEHKKLEDLRHNLLYLPIMVLKKHVEQKSADVVGIAGGPKKHDAIYAATKAGFFNVLITDAITAYSIYEKAEAEKNNKT